MSQIRPLAIDLFCGLGGWAEGFLSEGWDVIGFDIERHRYPIYERTNEADPSGVKAPGNDTFKKNGQPCNKLTDRRYGSGVVTQALGETLGWHEYPGQLVLQDVTTLHGSQLRNASAIVASPPCQGYSYRAMPWKRAKALGPPDNTLFETCFRLQREASEAAGRYIPLIVENVRGAQPWVGRAVWHYGSFYLWGDVPALMPFTSGRKSPAGMPVDPKYGLRFPLYGSNNPMLPTKNNGGSWFAIGSPGQTNVGQNPDGRKVPVYSDPRRNGGKGSRLTNPAENLRRLEEGTKNGNDWFGSGENCSAQRKHSSRSDSRKAASAQIAKIPLPLAQHIARVFKPTFHVEHPVSGL
jgi:hypothetical protein